MGRWFFGAELSGADKESIRFAAGLSRFSGNSSFGARTFRLERLGGLKRCLVDGPTGADRDEDHRVAVGDDSDVKRS
jgi:hypothetical protein